MALPVHFMVSPETQVDDTQQYSLGFTISEQDGSKRTYIKNVDAVAFTQGQPVVNPLGANSSYGNVVLASSADDQIADKLIGCVPQGVTIGVGKFGWVYASGPKVYAVVVTGSIAIPANTRLTLRFIGTAGLGIIPAGATSGDSVAVSTVAIGALDTSSVVDLRRAGSTS